MGYKKNPRFILCHFPFLLAVYCVVVHLDCIIDIPLQSYLAAVYCIVHLDYVFHFPTVFKRIAYIHMVLAF